MTVTLFISMLTIFALISSLLTEAIKKATQDTVSNNIIVGIVAAVVGWGGGAAVYVIFGIAWTVSNIVALILLAPACWLGAMLGYDKVIQTIKQIVEVISKKSK